MDFKETLLHAILEADLNPNLAVVQMVINAGVGVNALDIDGVSPLWWSVTNGHEGALNFVSLMERTCTYRPISEQLYTRRSHINERSWWNAPWSLGVIYLCGTAKQTRLH